MACVTLSHVYSTLGDQEAKEKLQWLRKRARQLKMMTIKSQMLSCKEISWKPVWGGCYWNNQSNYSVTDSTFPTIASLPLFIYKPSGIRSEASVALNGLSTPQKMWSPEAFHTPDVFLYCGCASEQ